MNNKGPFYITLCVRRKIVEKTNNQSNQNTNLETAGKESRNEEAPKKKIWQKILVPCIVAVILLAFAGTIYYGKVVKPRQDIDKEAGYSVNDYISLDDYTGIDYEITQDEFDQCVSEETDYYVETKKAASDTNQIDFNYTGYINGKKDSNISQKEAELVIGQEELSIFKAFAEAISGHKAGETIEVTADGSDVNDISEDESDYTDKSVTFKLKINSVSKLVVDEVTDEWVEENYFDDYGLETAEDFYQWCSEYIQDQAKMEVWQKVVDKATMSGYPADLYDDIVTEFTQDANYYADQFGISTESYLQDFCGYTDETLEEEYLNEVKSELVMWYIARKERFSCSSEEIESKYEELYEDMGYDCADDMKEDYTKAEMKKAVILDKAQDYVYENANVTESYTVPEV
jgi:FKBP-type peptidyl-prolyl cis-trans isomerase (trigger factor)